MRIREKKKFFFNYTKRNSMKSSQMNYANQLRQFFINLKVWASLVVQWLRIWLLMQGTRVRALVQEDHTCRGAIEPLRHSYWACALQPVSHNYWACVPQLLSPCATTTEAHAPQLLKPACLEPVLCNREATTMRSPSAPTKSRPRAPQLEKAPAQQWRPNAAKNK